MKPHIPGPNSPVPVRTMELESKWIEVKGVNTHYVVGGEGLPLVLVHGGGATGGWGEWGPFLERFARDFRVYAPDLVGFGRSDKPPANYTTRFFAEFFDAYMEAMALGRVNLIGHSLGGGVSLAYALNHPERVEKLILVDSSGLSNELGLMGRVLIPLFTRIARIRRDHVYVSLMTGGKEREPGEIYWDRLPELQVPTLLVWGEWDGYLPVRWARMAHERIPNSELCVFERCWHAPQKQRPEAFARVVLDFLKRREGRCCSSV